MTTPDPFRALDGVEPAARWDDIVERAERPALATPTSLGDRRPLHRRPALLAAAVLAVLAVGTVALAATGSDDRTEEVAAGPRPEQEHPDAAAFWGRSWEITRLVDDGVEHEVLPTVWATIETAASEVGTIEIPTTCSGIAGGRASVVDGVLIADPATWVRSPVVCGAPGSPGQNEQNAFIAALFTARPTIAVNGERLVVAHGDDRLEAVAGAAAPYVGPVEAAPAFLWDHKWEVDQLVEAGEARTPVPDQGGQAPLLVANTAGFPQVTSGGITVDSEATGSISVSGCNGAGGPAHLDGDVLVADPGGFDDATGETFPGWASTEMACAGPDGEALMAQDAFLSALLQSGPTVRIVGDQLTIEQGGDRLEATLLPRDGDEGGSTGPGTPTTSTVPDDVTTSEPIVETTTTAAPTIPLPGTSVPVAGADAFFDRIWTVTAVSGKGASSAFEGATVDTRDGRVVVSGCNGAGGAVRLEGGQLVPDGEWATTAKGCLPADGEDLEAQDAWFDALLRDRPTLDVRGMVATLTTATAEVELLMS